MELTGVLPLDPTLLSILARGANRLLLPEVPAEDPPLDAGEDCKQGSRMLYFNSVSFLLIFFTRTSELKKLDFVGMRIEFKLKDRF